MLQARFDQKVILRIAIDLLKNKSEYYTYIFESLADSQANEAKWAESIDNSIDTSNSQDSYTKRINIFTKKWVILDNLLSQNIFISSSPSTHTNLKDITRIVRKLAYDYTKNAEKWKNVNLTEDEKYGEMIVNEDRKEEFNLDPDEYELVVKEVVKYFFYYELEDENIM